MLSAIFDNLNFKFKLDISCKSLIYPRDIQYKIKGSFIDDNIDVLVYPIENIIAEKFETIIDRGITNSRMRDFFDIFILMSDPSKYKINNTLLIETIYEVSNSRNTLNVLSNSLIILKNIEQSKEFNQYWENYIKNINQNANSINTNKVFNILSDIATQYLSKYTN